MPLENSIYYIGVAIILMIIGALLGGIIRKIQYSSNHKKQDSVEQKLDKVIQLLEKQRLTLQPFPNEKAPRL
ncbi:DUF4083 family protein [Bacillus cereus]|uniref:DUF4083 family protein n=1 Tax=Bacillus cereus TaxID=1396 RepID=UPI000BF61036|nr:DUF4083 family protein [Bacillus cereus]PFS97593.1 DUF4083 domain-containing protein [Bacillus cereus]